MPVVGRLAVWVATVVAIGLAALLVRSHGDDGSLPATTPVSPSSTTLTTSQPAPGSFVIEGALAGGSVSLITLDVYRVVAASEEAKPQLGDHCSTVAIVVPDRAIAIDASGAEVPVNQVLKGMAFLRVTGVVQEGALIYNRLEVIPWPPGVSEDTCT